MAKMYWKLSLVINSLIRILVQQFQQQVLSTSWHFFILLRKCQIVFSAPGMQVNTMCLSLARNYLLIYPGLLTFFYLTSCSLKQTPLESGRRLDFFYLFCCCFVLFCLNAYLEITHIYCEPQMYAYAEKHKGRTQTVKKDIL